MNIEDSDESSLELTKQLEELTKSPKNEARSRIAKVIKLLYSFTAQTCECGACKSNREIIKELNEILDLLV